MQPQEVQIERMVENQIERVKKCSKCGADIILRKKKTGEGKYLTCGGFPQCREGMFFPGFVQDVEVTSSVCPKVCSKFSYSISFHIQFIVYARDNYYMSFAIDIRFSVILYL